MNPGRRLALAVAVTLAGSGCWNFRADLEGRCADGGLRECRDGGDTGATDGGGVCALANHGFCRGAWCWERPWPQGNPALAVAPHGSDLWFGGAGPMLGSYSTTTRAFTDRSSLLPPSAFSTTGWGDDTSIRGAASTDAGVWLIGAGLPLLRSAGGAPFTTVTPGKVWTTIAAADDRVVVANTTGAFDLSTSAKWDRASNTVTSLALVPGGCVLGVGNVGGWQLVDCATGTVLGGDPNPFWAAANTPSGPAFGADDAVWVDDTGTWRRVPLNGTFRVQTMAPLGDDLALFSPRQDAMRWRADAGQLTSAPVTAPARSAAADPSGQFVWVGGEGGHLSRWDGGTDAPLMPPMVRESIRDFSATDDLLVAVSTLAIQVRSCAAGDDWVTLDNPGAHALWTAVTATPDTLWFIDSATHAWSLSTSLVGSLTDHGALGQLSPNAYLQVGAALTRKSGEVLLASGSDIRAAPGLQSQASFPGEFIVKLAEGADGGTLAAMTWTFSGGQQTASRLHVGSGTTWTSIEVPSSRLQGLAACPDGSFVVVGEGHLDRLSADGSLAAISTNPTLPALEWLGAAWCAGDGTIFVGTGSGFVARISPDGTMTRENTGWSSGGDGYKMGVGFLTANSSRIFLGGEQGAILSRPRP